MNTWEKIYSIFTLIFLAALVLCFFLFPQHRTLEVLIPMSLLGLIVNILFMCIIFRDIHIRPFPSQNQRYIWFALILFLWPSVLVYLPRYGFKQR